MAIVCLVWKAAGTNLDPIAIVPKTLCFTQYLLKNVEVAAQTCQECFVLPQKHSLIFRTLNTD